MKAEDRCGMCAFAQETESIEDVECHYNPPLTFPVPTQGGIGFASAFPRLKALTGWCRCFVKGEMVRRSVILPATKNMLELMK